MKVQVNTTIKNALKVNATVKAINSTIPNGTLDITDNGEYNVLNYVKAKVNVPIPSDYIKPSGTLAIDSNGTHQVREYESVEVNVSGVAVFEPKTNDEIEVIIPATPITKKYYLNNFIGNAEIIIE